MSPLKFKPWISENYNNSEKYGKILLLGESHYSEEVNLKLESTQEIIQDILDGTKHRNYSYYTKLGKLFNSSDYLEIFNNCAFANLIQEILTKPRIHPTKEQLDSIHEAFWKILNITQPKKIIVTSRRAWGACSTGTSL